MTRLMCSKDGREVEALKSELFRKGIRAEIRSNPLADALRVTRVELWVQDERDYFEAAKVYSAFQERGNDEQPKAQSPADTEEVYIEAQESPATWARSRTKNSATGASLAPAPEPATPTRPGPAAAADSGNLAEVSGLLEKDIEELLARDENWGARCGSLENTILGLEKSLGEAEAKAGAEASARLAAEKKASQMAELQGSLKHELAQRTAAEQELKRAIATLQAEVKNREQAAAAAVAKLDTQVRELRNQQTIVIGLRSELGAREEQLKDFGESLSQAGVALGTEKQARLAAEERLRECAVARAALEQQVTQQTQELQKIRAELQTRDAQVQAYLGRLNAIRNRLQGKR